MNVFGDQVSGTFLDHIPGHLEARFKHDAEFDYIRLDLRVTGETAITIDADDFGRMSSPVEHVSDIVECSVYMSSAFCPFADFIRFLEAIAIEVQECGFEWDPEGPSARMHWERRSLRDAGVLTIDWQSSKGSFSHRMLLNTRQAVRSLYASFRSFVESDQYDPLRYEELTIGEAIWLVMSNGSLDELGDALARLDSEKTITVIDRIREVIEARTRGGAKLCFPIDHFLETSGKSVSSSEDPWVGKQWDQTDYQQRIAELKKLFESAGMGWNGANLRILRSSAIENWLAMPEPAPRVPHWLLRH